MLRAFAFAALLALSACNFTVSGQQADEKQEAPARAIEAEARQFMADYAADLQRGDRAAVAQRYHSDGAYLVGEGDKSLMTKEEIAQLYLRDWNPPAAFSWEDLSYEPISEDAVLVIGRFHWTMPNQEQPLNFSYSSLLRRDSRGELRIRMEDESTPPPVE